MRAEYIEAVMNTFEFEYEKKKTGKDNVGTHTVSTCVTDELCQSRRWWAEGGLSIDQRFSVCGNVKKI